MKRTAYSRGAIRARRNSGGKTEHYKLVLSSAARRTSCSRSETREGHRAPEAKLGKDSVLQSRNSAGETREVKRGNQQVVKHSGAYRIFTASIRSRASFALALTSSGTVTICFILSREIRIFSRLTIFMLGQQANSEMQ